MLVTLLVTILIALSAGALAWLVFRILRRSPPRFLIPAVIGAAMLAFTIWNEYSWASRTTEALPAGVEVIERIAGANPWAPWTFLFPRADRMIAIDRHTVRTNERLPNHYLVELVLLERLMPGRRTALIVDCENARQVNVAGDATVLDAGSLRGAAWAPMRREANLFRAVCGSATPPSPPS